MEFEAEADVTDEIKTDADSIDVITDHPHDDSQTVFMYALWQTVYNESKLKHAQNNTQ